MPKLMFAFRKFCEKLQNNIILLKRRSTRRFEMVTKSFSRATRVFYLLVESESRKVMLNKTGPMFADHCE